mmetsp:Transcript_25623/g.60792  ORF Transcript_25623/g.60792 Transcript_25623/m.60792 type:complete len:105 (-) Transcript_25623:1027-1341(-)
MLRFSNDVKWLLWHKPMQHHLSVVVDLNPLQTLMMISAKLVPTSNAEIMQQTLITPVDQFRWVSVKHRKQSVLMSLVAKAMLLFHLVGTVAMAAVGIQVVSQMS